MREDRFVIKTRLLHENPSMYLRMKIWVLYVKLEKGRYVISYPNG
jgi:hypothetical protein